MAPKASVTITATDSYKDIMDKANLMWQKEVDFKNHLKTTIKTSTKYLNTNTELAGLEIGLSDCLFTILDEISDNVDTLALSQTLKSIGKLRAKMVNQVLTDFTNPLTEFMDFKFGYAQYVRSQVKKSAREYQNQLDQFEKSNIIKEGKVSSGKLASIEKELHQVKDQINTNAKEYGKVMKDLEARKSTVILMQIIKCLEAHQSFFNNVALIFDDLIPKMEDLVLQLEDKNASNSVLKEGHLLAKRGKNTWNKEYFEVRDEKLFNYKIDKGLRYSGLMPEKTLELNLCSIKTGCPEKLKDRLKEDTKRCFQIFTPTKKPLVLLAPSKSESQLWIDSLLSAISQSLDNSNTFPSGSTGEEPQNVKVVKLLRSVPGNSNCIDCDAEEPMWASIKLGILVCVECSGVHRYLGVHITKVRSLTLDHWDPEQLIYMLKVGNEKANHFFECKIPEGYEKPTPKSTRAERERFITAKYKERLFIPPLTSSFNINSVLYEMVCTPKGFDVMKMLMLLFSGGDVNYKQDDNFLLMEAVKNDNWLYVHTLALFGVDLFSVDENGYTAFHHAAETNSYHSLLVLLRNGKERDALSLRDRNNENPLDIATNHNYTECQVLLHGHLSWTIPVDDLQEMIEEQGCDIPEPFPILVNCPELESVIGKKDSNSEIPVLIPSPEIQLGTEEEDSLIYKSAWKRGSEVGPSATSNNDKKANRISVLMSSISSSSSSRERRNTENFVPPGGGGGGGKDSKFNILSRKGKRQTTNFGTKSKDDEFSYGMTSSSSNNNLSSVSSSSIPHSSSGNNLAKNATRSSVAVPKNAFTSIDSIDLPDFYRNKPPARERSSLTPKSMFDGEGYEDESDTDSDDPGPPTFEPPPPPI